MGPWWVFIAQWSPHLYRTSLHWYGITADNYLSTPWTDNTNNFMPEASPPLNMSQKIKIQNNGIQQYNRLETLPPDIIRNRLKHN